MNEMIEHGAARVRDVLYSCRTVDQRENAAVWANGWIERTSARYGVPYDTIFNIIFDE